MGATRSQSQTKRDLILEVWESLDCESVGAKELEEIQHIVRERIGEGAVESPAAVARALADEGAVLRYPEVLECDATWREQNSRAAMFRGALNFGGLAEGSESMKRLEDLRIKLGRDSDQPGLHRLLEAVRQSREECLLVARSAVVGESQRAAAREIAGWLAVWLKQPEVFADWLDLRKRAADFIEQFPEGFC
jgi:hypothetical protein